MFPSKTVEPWYLHLNHRGPQGTFELVPGADKEALSEDLRELAYENSLETTIELMERIMPLLAKNGYGEPLLRGELLYQVAGFAITSGPLSIIQLENIDELVEESMNDDYPPVLIDVRADKDEDEEEEFYVAVIARFTHSPINPFFKKRNFLISRLEDLSLV